MLTPEEMMKQASGALRDQVLEFALRHEMEKHDGEVCRGNRASIVAYFAHSLGLTAEEMAEATLMKCRIYDVECTSKECHHNDVPPAPPQSFPPYRPYGGPR